jgi:hypothetical protein
MPQLHQLFSQLPPPPCASHVTLRFAQCRSQPSLVDCDKYTCTWLLATLPTEVVVQPIDGLYAASREHCSIATKLAVLCAPQASEFPELGSGACALPSQTVCGANTTGVLTRAGIRVDVATSPPMIVESYSFGQNGEPVAPMPAAEPALVGGSAVVEAVGWVEAASPLCAIAVIVALVLLGPRSPWRVGQRIRDAYMRKWVDFAPGGVQTVALLPNIVDGSATNVEADGVQDEIRYAAYTRWRQCGGIVAAIYAAFETVVGGVLAGVLSIWGATEMSRNTPSVRGEFVFFVCLVVMATIAASLFRLVVFIGVARDSRLGGRVFVRAAYFSQFAILVALTVVPVTHLRYSDSPSKNLAVRNAIVSHGLLRCLTLAGPPLITTFPALAHSALRANDLFPHVQILGRLVQTAALAQTLVILISAGILISLPMPVGSLLFVYTAALLLFATQFSLFRAGRAMVINGDLGAAAPGFAAADVHSSQVPAQTWRRSAFGMQGAALATISLGILLAYTDDWLKIATFFALLPGTFFVSLMLISDVITQSMICDKDQHM